MLSRPLLGIWSSPMHCGHLRTPRRVVVAPGASEIKSGSSKEPVQDDSAQKELDEKLQSLTVGIEEELRGPRFEQNAGEAMDIHSYWVPATDPKEKILWYDPSGTASAKSREPPKAKTEASSLKRKAEEPHEPTKKAKSQLQAVFPVAEPAALADDNVNPFADSNKPPDGYQWYEGSRVMMMEIPPGNLPAGTACCYCDRSMTKKAEVLVACKSCPAVLCQSHASEWNESDAFWGMGCGSCVGNMSRCSACEVPVCLDAACSMEEGEGIWCIGCS